MRFFITVFVLVAGGILASSSLIVSRKPNAKDLIDKLTPYQGGIGVTMFIWGIFNLISFLPNMGVWFKASAFSAIIMIIAIFTLLILGFLLGFGLITKYALSKNETAMEKGQAIRAKLAVFQGPLGLVSICIGLLVLIGRFL